MAQASYNLLNFWRSFAGSNQEARSERSAKFKKKTNQKININSLQVSLKLLRHSYGHAK